MKELSKKYRLVWGNDNLLKFPVEEMQGTTYVGKGLSAEEFDTQQEAETYSMKYSLFYTE